MISDEEFAKSFTFIFCCIITVSFIIAATIWGIKNKNITETPIDATIVKANDSIKIKVNNLDSIKNAKVIEVQKLDNDSTVKLFYKLIK